MSSSTLMRQSVKKPQPSLKRQIKLSPAIDIGGSQITISEPSTLGVKTVYKNIDVKKSDNVQRFYNINSVTSEPEQSSSTKSKHIEIVATPQKAVTVEVERSKNSLDLLLEKAITEATSHLEPSPKIRKKRLSWFLS